MSSFQFFWLWSCLFFPKYFIFSVNFSAHSLSACLHSQRRGWRSEFAAAGGNIKCFAKEPPHPHTFCPSLSTVLDSRLRRKLYQRATSSFSRHLLSTAIACWYMDHQPSLPATNSKCGILWHLGMLVSSYCCIIACWSEQWASPVYSFISTAAPVCPSAIEDNATRFVI